MKDRFRIDTHRWPYLNGAQVKMIYVFLKRESKGLDKFWKEVKEVGTKEWDARYFCDETKLFDVLKKYCSEELKRRGINTFSELMQALPMTTEYP